MHRTPCVINAEWSRSGSGIAVECTWLITMQNIFYLFLSPAYRRLSKSRSLSHEVERKTAGDRQDEQFTSITSKYQKHQEHHPSIAGITSIASIPSITQVSRIRFSSIRRVLVRSIWPYTLSDEKGSELSSRPINGLPRRTTASQRPALERLLLKDFQVETTNLS